MSRAVKPIDSTFFRSASACFLFFSATICSVASLAGALVGFRTVVRFTVAVLPVGIVGAFVFAGSGAEDEEPPVTGAAVTGGAAGSGAGRSVRSGLSVVISE